MKYVLLLLFFTSPPGKPENQIWTLVNVNSTTFESKPSCEAAGNTVQNAANVTSTLRVTGWCFVNSGNNPLSLNLPLKGLSIDALSGMKPVQ